MTWNKSVTKGSQSFLNYGSVVSSKEGLGPASPVVGLKSLLLCLENLCKGYRGFFFFFLMEPWAAVKCLQLATGL